MIPDYESFMTPLLRVMSDGRERSIAECRDLLAQEFALSEDDLSELLPSGRMPKFNSRVHWAKTYLEKAQTLESTGRGRIRITDRGQRLFAEANHPINTAMLTSLYQEMRDWREVSRGKSNGRVTSVTGTDAPEELPPDESLAESFQRYRQSVQAEILDRIKRMPPGFFERLVVDLLLKLGYGGPFGTGLTLGRSGDRGVDGVIHQDKLGLDLLYVQAKRWEGSVGGSVVREFAGALSAHRARKGLIITTSTFTRDAIADAERMAERIVLIDGSKLAELLYETGLGMVTETTLEMRRIDSDYFEG